MAPIAVEPTGLTPEQAPWATALRDAGVSHGGARPLACACAKKLAQVSREERAEQSRTCPIQAPPAVGCGAGRMARNPARCRGTRKRKRPTGEGWAWKDGGAVGRLLVAFLCGVCFAFFVIGFVERLRAAACAQQNGQRQCADPVCPLHGVPPCVACAGAATNGAPVRRWISIRARWASSAASSCCLRAAVRSDCSCAHSR